MGLLTPMTKLEAVNTMLRLLGERKVNSLTDPTRLDVIGAIDALDEMTKRVQIESWWFNERLNQDLLPVNGIYNIPNVWLKVDVIHRSSSKQFVYRDKKLFNLKTGAFDGNTETIKVDYTEEIAFDQLPQSARSAIATSAAVLFTTERIGSREMLREIRENAEQAWSEMQAEELQASDTNLIHQPEIARVLLEHRR